MHHSGFLLRWIALVGSGLVFLLPTCGHAATNEFAFNEYLLAPVRVHLLSAKNLPTIQTTLAEKDIARILGKLNGVWAQAGLHFYLESLVREEAIGQETFAQRATQGVGSGLLELRPDASKATRMFHLYYIKDMPNTPALGLMKRKSTRLVKRRRNLIGLNQQLS